MNEELFAELVARYQSMDEWQIAELDAKKESLTEEARIALRGVVLDRKINLSVLKKEKRIEEKTDAEVEEIKKIKKEKWNENLEKWMVIVGIPIIAIGTIFRPDRSYEIFLSTLIKGVYFTLFVVVIYGGRRLFRKKSHK